jgi:glucuronosyltransferase
MLPQQDLLAHPNLKVFVTHGGLLSLQEALYHQTPLVGIPLGNDQKPNMLRAEKKGYGKTLVFAL